MLPTISAVLFIDVFCSRFGGDFYYPSGGLDDEHSLLLVAGGVGINPLYSIWLEAAQLARSGVGTSPGSVALLYSAADSGELIFSSSMDQVVGEIKQFSTKYFITKEGDKTREVTGRISKSDLEEELSKRSGSRTSCYLCGPHGRMLMQ